MRLSTLKGKFLVPSITLVFLGMILSMLISYYIASRAIQNLINQQVTQLASSMAKDAVSWFNVKDSSMRNWSRTQRFRNALIDQSSSTYSQIAYQYLTKLQDDEDGFESVSITDINGQIISSSTQSLIGMNVGDREFFKIAVGGDVSISTVRQSQVSGKPVLTIAYPIEEKELGDDDIIGTVFGVVELNSFTEKFVNSIKVGKTGSVVIAREDGLIIASANQKIVMKINIKDLGLHQEFLQKEKGVFECYINGEEKIVAFQKMETTHWIIGVAVNSSEVFSALVILRIANIILTILVISALSGALIFLLNKLVRRPLSMVVETADAIALGDLSRQLDYTSNDEVGNLSQAFSHMVRDLKIKENHALQMAKGDLSVDVKLSSDKDTLGKAFSEMSNNLRGAFDQVKQAVIQITAGSSQVSAASQILAQGAVQHAASLEEISSSITELETQTQASYENAVLANQLANETSKSAENGRKEMSNMLEAMDAITESSVSIGKIIKVIDEIAFQTNLLALNAAVEAARAGKYGKGFAVVADEVRNLASRSAAAAREVTELIGNSEKKVENGNQIAQQTAESFNHIVDASMKLTDLIGEIAAASKEQSLGIGQINLGIEQVTQVTQDNSSNAEETASVTEELNDQAERLRQTLTRFKLSVTDIENNQNIVQLKPKNELTHTNQQLPNARQASEVFNRDQKN